MLLFRVYTDNNLALISLQNSFLHRCGKEDKTFLPSQILRTTSARVLVRDVRCSIVFIFTWTFVILMSAIRNLTLVAITDSQLTNHLTPTLNEFSNETTNAYNWSNASISGNDTTHVQIQHPLVGIVLALFSTVTIVGNILVIIAVSKELYLRTVTNYFIVSLAIADLMVGGIVMPFSISLEVTNQIWIYGTEWCDLWHSFDVLASTASILNLCVISLDRFWAITDPIAYPSKMSHCKVCLLIAFVWLCSAGISFPAIAWWKAVTPGDMPAYMCLFTEDSAYLIFSSFVSFYCPTIIMMFVYWRIYLAAAAQIRSLKIGSKVLTTTNGSHGHREIMTLRMHRGGNTRRTSDEYNQNSCVVANDSDSAALTTMIQNNVNGSDHGQQHRPTKFITKRLRQFALSKKLTKLAREQKAAKTLGIVVGVFIICWLPFFVFNILQGICGESCLVIPDILFPVFTWLGYINSGMNPVIYALSMRDFRRAFGRILCCCCPKQRFTYTRAHKKYATSTSSFTVPCADRV